MNLSSSLFSERYLLQWRNSRFCRHRNSNRPATGAVVGAIEGHPAKELPPVLPDCGLKIVGVSRYFLPRAATPKTLLCPEKRGSKGDSEEQLGFARSPEQPLPQCPRACAMLTQRRYPRDFFTGHLKRAFVEELHESMELIESRDTEAPTLGR
jgi:hypothetical protein